MVFSAGIMSEGQLPMTVEQLVPQPGHIPVFQVFIEAHHPVDYPGRGDFHDPVRHCGNELVVV